MAVAGCYYLFICFNYITAERERERDRDPSAGYFLSALIDIGVLFTDIHLQLISLNVFMVFLSSRSITWNEDRFVSGSVKKVVCCKGGSNI